MPVVASGVIVAWPSTNASIPSGWSEETNLATKYVRGAAAAGDADLTSVFGTATHSHTSTSHTPTQNAHNHDYSSGGSSGTVTSAANFNDVSVASTSHSHASKTSTNTTAVTAAFTITVDTTSNDLAYKEVLWIKSDGSPTGIPAGAYAFFANDSLPPLWSRVMGNQWPKGAASGGNGGAAGGSNTHTHTSPAHTHAASSHGHAGSGPSNSNTGTVTRDAGAGSSASVDGHTHSITFGGKTIVNNSVTTTLSTDSGEPPYYKLNIISNGNSSADMPDQIIAIWGSTNASIPAAWARYTAMDTNFLKGCNADGEVANTGGATTHTHTASDCQPTTVAHNHIIISGVGTEQIIDVGAGITVASSTHTHTWTVTNATATHNAVAVTINANTSESAYPVYAKVIFIKWTLPVSAIRQRAVTGVGL